VANASGLLFDFEKINRQNGDEDEKPLYFLEIYGII
jgi:hypothetical protein